MKSENKILLIGGSGTLGSSIIKSKLFKNIDAPSKNKLNLLKRANIKKRLKNKYSLIINCAAMARMKECELSPSKAININVFGALNLVREIINYQKKFNKKIKLLHISSDGVYPSLKGNYSENSKLKPYNIYGLTKMYAEKSVMLLKSYVIIRTNFFDKKKIKFKNAATDIYTSMLEVESLVKKIKLISLSSFNGIINVGSQRKSNYRNFKKYKKNIKPCKRADIVKNLNFNIPKDSSMNLGLFKKVIK